MYPLWHFPLRNLFGCPSAMPTVESSPLRPRTKARWWASFPTWNIWGGFFVQFRNKAGKYDFSLTGCWWERGFSGVWGPRNLPTSLTKQKRLKEQNKWSRSCITKSMLISAQSSYTGATCRQMYQRGHCATYTSTWLRFLQFYSHH